MASIALFFSSFNSSSETLLAKIIVAAPLSISPSVNIAAYSVEDRTLITESSDGSVNSNSLKGMTEP